MYLIHESTVKQPNGVIEVTVLVVNESGSRKRYTFVLRSAMVAELFQFYYNKGRGLHGVALTVLNRHKINNKVGKEHGI